MWVVRSPPYIHPPHFGKLLTRLLADRTYDYAVIGAGGSGMLLLLALHEQGALINKHVIVFEPVSQKGNDRTWCFWAVPDDPIVASLQPVIDAHWEIVNTPAGPAPVAPFHYYHIRSEKFYGYVRQQLAAYPNIVWCTEQVHAVHATTSGNQIAAAHTYKAQQVFDSRLNEMQSEYLQNDAQVLWQSFAGYRVKLPKGSAQRDVMEMMDFSIPQDGHCQFMYVLPFSDEHLLVEMTRFGRQRLEMEEAAPVLDAYIKRKWGGYEMEEEELGAIPMSLRLGQLATPTQHGYTPIGTAAGAVKATTGYAFYTMYRHAQELARHATNPVAQMPVIPRKGRYAFYDSLLLRILLHRPWEGGSIFTRLLERIPPPQVFRFLQEQSSPKEEISILASLPKIPFLRALGSSLLSNRANILLLVAVLLLTIQWAAPVHSSLISQILLAVGLLFPGIPHGALDHVLTMPDRKLSWRMWPFVAGYIAIMAMVALIWWGVPAIGLLLFIAYSAWHFGETDYREWRTYSPLTAVFHGLGLLLFLLGTHWQQLTPYFHLYGLDALNQATSAAVGSTLAGIFGLAMSGMELPAARRPQWIKLMALLAIASFLPILTAFALYFIGHHSLNGWNHIRQTHQFSHRQMMMKALPFSSMALLFFLLFGLLFLSAEAVAASLWPVFFIFLAAVSAPHIWYMHRFYSKAAIHER